MGNFVTVYRLLKDFLPTVGFNSVHREVPANLVHAVPLVTVVRYGGTDKKIVIDQPAVQIDVFASTADKAEDLGEDLRTALGMKLPRYQFGGAVVTGVGTISGPQILPWSATSIWRVSARYQISVHQFSGIG